MIKKFLLTLGLVCSGACIGGASGPDCAPLSEIVRGPWTVPSGAALFVRFEAAEKEPEAACVRLTLPDGSVRRTAAASVIRSSDGAGGTGFVDDDAGTFRLYELQVPVEQGGRFVWSIDTVTGAVAGSAVARSVSEPATILVIGDTNSSNPATDAVTGDATGLGITQTLLRDAWARGVPDVLIHAGDIAYHLSVPLDNWTSFWRTFGGALTETVFLPATGNHEYEFDREFETFMVPWFGVTGPVPTGWNDGEPVTTISRRPDVLSWDAGPARIVTVNSNFDELSDADIDTIFSEAQGWLAAAGDRWKVIVFHHPIYTESAHAPVTTVRERVLALDDAVDLDLVITGHNHVYERFDVSRFHNIVSGGGGAFLYAIDDTPPDPDATRVVGVAAHHVVRLTVEPEQIQLVATDLYGKVIDEATLEHR